MSTDHNISTASDRFLLASNEYEDYHDDTYVLFQPKILSTIAALRLKHKRPDINSIYEHFTMIEASNVDKEFIKGVILQMIKDGIISNKKSPNEYDSFYRKLSTDNDNINPSQQPSAINTPSHFLSDTFTPPQNNIKTPVIDKIKNVKQSEDAKLEAQFSALKSYVICGISALVQKIEQISESLNNLK